MFCPECGYKNVEGAAFCENCGTKLTGMPGSINQKETAYEKTGENFNGCKFSAAAQTTAA